MVSVCRKPLNGETAFVDLAAAFEALPAAEQATIARLQVHPAPSPQPQRKLLTVSGILPRLQVRRPGSYSIARADAHGWGDAAYGSADEKERSFTSTLVRTNPRTGRQSLYSPWECRGPGSGPRVVGMSEQENAALLDHLEMHCLQPEFRHNQLHTPGDVTLWWVD